jgi:hypothetical protein
MPSLSLNARQAALIDEVDLERVSALPWHAHRTGPNRVCAVNRTPGRPVLQMHRFILGAKAGEIVDHINGDPLDNRRCNLRIVTPRQNSMNRRASSTSGYLGVTASGGKFQAGIWPDRMHINLGRYDTAIAAAAAYNGAARAIYGEFARLNDAPIDADIFTRLIADRRAAITRLEREIAFLSEVPQCSPNH